MTAMVILVKKVLMGGSSLVVQWLDLGFHCDGPGFKSVIGELKILHALAKKKKKRCLWLFCFRCLLCQGAA